MTKEQASPVAIIELTDEELEGMRGGCHGDDNWDYGSDCDDSRRSENFGDRHDFGGDDRFSFSGYDRSYDRRW
jgi:hypothetical protein